MNNNHYSYQSLPPLARIAELERIRDGKGDCKVAYPYDHGQRVKINEQIEEIKRKEKVK